MRNMNVKIEHEMHIKVDKDVEELLKSRSVYSEAIMKKVFNTMGADAESLLTLPVGLNHGRSARRERVTGNAEWRYLVA